MLQACQRAGVRATACRRACNHDVLLCLVVDLLRRLGVIVSAIMGVSLCGIYLCVVCCNTTIDFNYMCNLPCCRATCPAADLTCTCHKLRCLLCLTAAVPWQIYLCVSHAAKIVDGAECVGCQLCTTIMPIRWGPKHAHSKMVQDAPFLTSHPSFKVGCPILQGISLAAQNAPRGHQTVLGRWCIGLRPYAPNTGYGCTAHTHS
jgi:hypothetical protein